MSKHAALVRGEDGGLDVRLFKTPEEARAASEPQKDFMRRAFEQMPAFLAEMRELQGDKMIMRVRDDGGIEIDVTRRNKLYVSRWEMAEMLPKFSPDSNPTRFLDELIKLGLPYSDPTGSKIFDVEKCHTWIERHFARSGRNPNA